jgi:NadR type nicotinamide-nucleotide adenylyltransferase
LNKYKISIIGPESTGKTTLCKQLAKHYQTIWLPEYARKYVEKLDRKYLYFDIEHIAKKQIELEKKYFEKATNYLFIDNELIIIKTWFQFVYNKYPDWLDDEILKNKSDLYLLCYYDLPWIEDKVRENGGKNREILFNSYQEVLLRYNFDFKIIKGIENERIKNSINEINIFFRYLNNRNYN